MSGRFIHSTTSKRRLCINAQLMFPRHISTSLRPLSTAIDTPNVSLELKDKVAILTLNNPLKRNALTTRMMVELDQHVQTLSNNIKSNSDANTRVVILTGVPFVLD